VEPGAPANTAQYRAASECREIARDVARSWPTNVLLGMNSEVTDAAGEVRLYNSALLLKPPGEVAGRYDKMHRVPFGEYVPLRKTLPWLNAFAPYDFDYSISIGDTFTRFTSAATARRRSTSCSTFPTTAGSMAPASTRNISPFVAFARWSAGGRFCAP
jgi:hypothetical protein